MPASDDHFAEFKPHSRHKHLILEYYIRGWARKLLLRPGAGDRVRIVDACAGRGHDEAGNPGSPLIVARAAVEATAQLQADFDRPVAIEVIAIEKKPAHFKELTAYLAPFGDTVKTLNGTLSDYLVGGDPKRDVPTFFFIDPFGIEPLQAETVSLALRPPHAECFVLFAAQSALRHFGAAQAVETKAVKALRNHEAQIGIFEALHAEETDRLETRARQSQKSLDITKDRAVEILDAAFGGHHWFEEISHVSAGQRRDRFLALYADFLRKAGARHVLAIPMLDEGGVHVYFLVYATKSSAGHQLMKESVEHALRHSPLPQEVTDAIWHLLRTDLSPVLSLVRERFAGKAVRWTPDPADKKAENLRTAVLGETAVYPFQVDELKALLRPFKRPGRGPHIYDFPRS